MAVNKVRVVLTVPLELVRWRDTQVWLIQAPLHRNVDESLFYKAFMAFEKMFCNNMYQNGSFWNGNNTCNRLGSLTSLVHLHSCWNWRCCQNQMLSFQFEYTQREIFFLLYVIMYLSLGIIQKLCWQDEVGRMLKKSLAQVNFYLVWPC